MNLSELLFWNVDTQVDFVFPEGKLFVKDAQLLLPKWKQITEFASLHKIRVVNTADFHYANSAELSDTPDYITTFPEHCMANTIGADYVAETMPENPVIFDWNKEYSNVEQVLNNRNIIIRKDAFDVFAGNPYTEKIVNVLAPKKVMVYGVTTNVCVNDAVVGLAKRVENVYVIKDAIKELPNIPLPFKNWNRLGVKMISFEELKKLVA